MLPIAVPEFYEEFPVWFQVIFDSGITACTITAVILNAVFNVYGRPGEREAAVFSEAPSPASITDDDEERIGERPLSPNAGRGRGRNNEFVSRRARGEAPRA
ncbi:MAG: purine permease, partial [Ornithinimicrobium sp.]